MKLIITLAAVSLILVACGKSGSDDSGTASALSVSGSYAVKATRANGDIVMIFTEFSAGQYSASDYKFIGGDMSKATFVKWTSSDIVSGNIHTTTITHATCSTLNGITPPNTESFPVTPLANNQILLHSNGANADVLMDKIDSVEQWLADKGTYMSTEVTDCTVAF